MLNGKPSRRIEAQDVLDLAEQIRPLLAGKGPGAQGAVLALLTATWLRGHPPEVRDAVLRMHAEQVRGMVDAQ